jgi:hypothetical protein
VRGKRIIEHVKHWAVIEGASLWGEGETSYEVAGFSLLVALMPPPGTLSEEVEIICLKQTCGDCKIT